MERYTRLGKPISSPGGGGLGVYIAQRLARANHGELQVTDPPAGRGARLELRLPLATPPMPPAGGPGQ